MLKIEADVDRCLVLLRNRIHERGFTQLEVQETLGWGRSYISQLLTKQKKLRIEQVLLTLAVIGIEPAEFFSDLYGFPAQHDGRAPVPSEPFRTLEQLRLELHGVIELLLEKNLISIEELSAAAETETAVGIEPLT